MFLLVGAPPPGGPAGARWVAPRYMGTVKPARNFDARKDAEAINKALKGFVSKDTKTIMSILCQRSNPQRQEIATAYKTMFDKVGVMFDAHESHKFALFRILLNS